VDFNGKDPLIDPSAEWLRAAEAVRHRASGSGASSSGRHRISERHRVRRRSRKPSDIRAKIRVRVWLTCTGALIAMVLAIYLALGRGSGGEAGQLLLAPGDAIATEGATPPHAG
jgi:hypothetical protein